MDPSQRRPTLAWRGGFADGSRTVPEESPVALTYNRLSHAVMMATPADLQDFAVGFSLTEGIITDPAEITEFEVVERDEGLELRMWIDAERMLALEQRRRVLAGPTGCGLCGLDSLAQAVRPPAPIRSGLRIGADEIARAVAALPQFQHLNHATRAVHAAGFWRMGAAMQAVREDVGRHNALDKLVGAVARARVDGQAGVVVMTSRISFELVQKTAAIGAPILVAVSAPTRLAIDMADRAGLTLIGIARSDGFEVFTHPERVFGAPPGGFGCNP